MVPSETVSFSAGLAKLCQAKVVSEVRDTMVRIVNPVLSTLLTVAKMACGSPSWVIVTIGSESYGAEKVMRTDVSRELDAAYRCALNPNVRIVGSPTGGTLSVVTILATPSLCG